MHPLIKQELDNLSIQFGNKSVLTLDDYAVLYGISRASASRHLRRRGIPVSKEGRQLYVSTLDLAIYKARCKLGDNAPFILNGRTYSEQMKSRRGFNQMAERRQLVK